MQRVYPAGITYVCTRTGEIETSRLFMCWQAWLSCSNSTTDVAGRDHVVAHAVSSRARAIGRAERRIAAQRPCLMARGKRTVNLYSQRSADRIFRARANRYEAGR